MSSGLFLKANPGREEAKEAEGKEEDNFATKPSTSAGDCL
jgi:hypothetical protein